MVYRAVAASVPGHHCIAMAIQCCLYATVFISPATTSEHWVGRQSVEIAKRGLAGTRFQHDHVVTKALAACYTLGRRAEGHFLEDVDAMICYSHRKCN